MKINIYRDPRNAGSQWTGIARLETGLVVARASGATWFEVWMRLSRLFGVLRMRHSVSVSA
jgi:hypothetical protein